MQLQLQMYRGEEVVQSGRAGPGAASAACAEIRAADTMEVQQIWRCRGAQEVHQRCSKGDCAGDYAGAEVVLQGSAEVLKCSVEVVQM